MRKKLALSFFVCVIAFAQQVWPGNVDTSAAYMTVFGRPATQVEIDYWKNRLPATQDELVEINMNWLVSPSGAKDLKETVVRGFQQVYQRVPTANEQQDWEKKIKASRLKYQDFTASLKSSVRIKSNVLIMTQGVDTTSAYQTVFGRPATQVEIDYWQNRLPASQAELVETNMKWLISPAGAKDLRETVVRGFQQVLQRQPNAAEQQDWENKIKASRLKYQDFTATLGGSVQILPKVILTTPQAVESVHSISNTQHEEQMPLQMQRMWDIVGSSFYEAFGRMPDDKEREALTTSLESKERPYREIIQAHLSLLSSTAGSNERNAMIKRCYVQVFGREPSPDEYSYWNNSLKNQPQTYAQMVEANKKWLSSPKGASERLAITDRLAKNVTFSSLSVQQQSLIQNKLQYGNTYYELSQENPQVGQSDNILNTEGSYAENSMVATSKLPNCAGGAKGIMSSGWGAAAVTKELNDPAIATVQNLLDKVDPEEVIYEDSQIVRLKDGKLLIVRTGGSTEAITPQPPWWNFFDPNDKTVNYKCSKIQPGNRGTYISFVSSNCGKDWHKVSTLDTAKVQITMYYPNVAAVNYLGLLAFPRVIDQKVDPNHPEYKDCYFPHDAAGAAAQKGKWFGGGDRFELYADPWNGKVYLSTHVVAGGAPGYAAFDKSLIFVSEDDGITWNSNPLQIPSGVPMVMTSTRDGTLFIAQKWGRSIKLYWSTDFGKSVVNPDGIRVNPKGIQVSDKAGADTANGFADFNATDLAPGGASHPIQFFEAVSISRVEDPAGDRVRIAYPVLLQGTPNHQEQHITTVLVKKDGTYEIDSKEHLIKGSNGGSILSATFIQADRVELPADNKTDKAMIYWIETIPPQGDSEHPNLGKLAAKYEIVSGAAGYSSPKYLSLLNGEPYTWDSSFTLGDYMRAGSFYDGELINFVPQWAETDIPNDKRSVIHFNVVKVQP